MGSMSVPSPQVPAPPRPSGQHAKAPPPGFQGQGSFPGQRGAPPGFQQTPQPPAPQPPAAAGPAAAAGPKPAFASWSAMNAAKKAAAAAAATAAAVPQPGAGAAAGAAPGPPASPPGMPPALRSTFFPAERQGGAGAATMQTAGGPAVAMPQPAVPAAAAAAPQGQAARSSDKACVGCRANAAGEAGSQPLQARSCLCSKEGHGVYSPGSARSGCFL